MVWMAAFSWGRSIVPHQLGSFYSFPGAQSPQGCQPRSFYQPLYSHEIKTQAKPNRARHPIQTAIFSSTNLHHLLSPSMSWDPADGPARFSLGFPALEYEIWRLPKTLCRGKTSPALNVSGYLVYASLTWPLLFALGEGCPAKRRSWSCKGLKLRLRRRGILFLIYFHLARCSC